MDGQRQEESSLDAYAKGKLTSLEGAGLRRRLIETDRTDTIRVVRGGRTLLSFCCNDYLNLSHHPEVIRAAQEAAGRLGTGAGASRLVTGNHSILGALEAKLAHLKRTEACLVFGSGYLANLGAIPALVGPSDLIVMDELAHACMHGGARLSGATIETFAHNDVDAARAILAKRRSEHPRCLLLTETIFSMDGDRAPLAELGDLAHTFDAWFMTDDAHGLGIAPHISNPADIQMGTLSKGAGSYGGYVCASRAVVDLLVNRARSFIYSTGLPPASAAAALAALDIMERDPALCARPLALARDFTHRLQMAEAQSAIVPVILGDAERALAASRSLEADGFLVIAIRPPTVPAGTARLRITFTAEHNETDVARLAEAVAHL